VTFHSLKTKFIYIIYNHPVRTAKKTQHFTITQINRLTLFKEIIAVYSENHTKHINKLSGQNSMGFDGLVLQSEEIFFFHFHAANIDEIIIFRLLMAVRFQIMLV
jgi:hypothetical protein